MVDLFEEVEEELRSDRNLKLVRSLVPWVTGVLHDALGDYSLAFWLGAGISVVSALAIWQASPRKVRAVAGRVSAA